MSTTSPAQKSVAMKLPQCLCEAVFGTKTSLGNHATQQGHSHRCSCGEFFGSLSALQFHQRKSARKGCQSDPTKQLVITNPHLNRPNRHYCGICPNRYFADIAKRNEHLMFSHKACPTCFRTFSSADHLRAHQKASAHCYCPEHNMVFSRLEDLAQHACTGSHIVSYDCLICEISFSNQVSYHDHFNDEDHDRVTHEAVRKQHAASTQLARVEEANLWCKECNQYFISPDAYTAHKKSPKHTATRVDRKCGCGSEFYLVSALLQHLESGNCPRGMTRDKLNAIIYRSDKERLITMPEYADHFLASTVTGSSRTSIVPDDSASVLKVSVESVSCDSSRTSRIFTPHTSTARSEASTQGGVDMTPTGSDDASTDSQSIMTPPASNTDSTLSGSGVVLTPYPSTVGPGVLVSATASSDGGGIVYTPSASTIGTNSVTSTTRSSVGRTVICTPSGSSISYDSDEWDYIRSSLLTPASESVEESSTATVRLDAMGKSLLCAECSRSFPTAQDLRQHLGSAVHNPKIFRCPTGASGGPPARAQDREFSTASGLLQHIETGVCGEGDDAMKTVLKVVEKPMQKAFTASKRSLGK